MKKVLKFFIFFFIIFFLLFRVFNIQIIALKWLYPMEYSDYVEKYADEYKIDSFLVYAVIKAESNFDEHVVSNSNAKGIMQIMDTTAQEVAKNIMDDTVYEDSLLFDPEINIKIGSKYLSELLEKYNGNYYLAVAAYNAGIGTVDRWIQDGIIKQDGSDIENIPYKETNNYVRKIIRDYKIYRDLYE